ncbi:hypothetical protein HZB00_00610 [Candidatus Woesearchaeota archaeon]|nr:hypothetical protein [Candidatus Woesearchaeota archaeon]
MRIDWNKLEFLAKGKRGKVFLWKKKYVIKIKNPESEAEGRIENEARFLKKVNKRGIGPKVIEATKEYVISTFIPGIRIDEYLEKTKHPGKVLNSILDQCFILDQLKINKLEMHHPVKHIIINKNKPVFIDFERCYETNNPKNVTQFCQFILNREEFLKTKGIVFNKEKVMQIIKKYKKSHTKKDFQELKKEFNL